MAETNGDSSLTADRLFRELKLHHPNFILQRMLHRTGAAIRKDKMDPKSQWEYITYYLEDDAKEYSKLINKYFRRPPC